MATIKTKEHIIKECEKGYSLYPCGVLNNCVRPGKSCLGCTFSYYVNIDEDNYYHTLPLNTEERNTLIDKVIDITVLKLTLGS